MSTYHTPRLVGARDLTDQLTRLLYNLDCGVPVLLRPTVNRSGIRWKSDGKLLQTRRAQWMMRSRVRRRTLTNSASANCSKKMRR